MLTSQARIRADLNTAGYYTEGVASSGILGIDGNTETFKLSVSAIPNIGIHGTGQLVINPNANAGQSEVLIESFVGGVTVESGSALLITAADSIALDTPTDIHLNPTGNVFVASLAAGGPVSSQVGTGELLNTSGSLSQWLTVAVPTIMQQYTGYFANAGGGVAFALPAIAVEGATFAVANVNAGGWSINQNAGQSIIFGAQQTTVGVLGGLASNAIGDTVTIVCYVANTTFVVTSSMGNIQVI